MAQQKTDKTLEESEINSSKTTPEEKPLTITDKKPDSNGSLKGKFGPEVYDDARKFNTILMTRGPAILFGLGKAAELAGKNSNLVTGVGGAVVGAVSFFGNRHFRSKGDDSTLSYMGQLMGCMQFSVGLMLLAVTAAEVYSEKGDATPLLAVIKMLGVALALTEAALVLVNSNLYGDGTPKEIAPERRKYD